MPASGLSQNEFSTNLSLTDIYGERTSRSRRIAIFGPRGSGKTCFFASLYGYSADGDIAVSIVEESTLLYMESQWGAYRREGGFPGATANETPQRLAFDVAQATTDRNWQVEVLDHAGALIERSGFSDDDLRRLVRSWLQECEAILIFLDTSSKSGGGAIERRNEVAQLLGILREESESAKITKPLGLLFTKWDERGPRPESASEAAKCVAEYLRLHPEFKQIRDTLVAFGMTMTEFPISALGWDRKPLEFPESPYNLLPPLVWALEQTDRQRFVQAKKLADSASASKSIQFWTKLIQDDGIASGPVFEDIQRELAQARQRRQRQMLTRISTIAVTITLLSMIGWFSWVQSANHELAKYRSYCQSEHGKLNENAEKRAAMAKNLVAKYGRVWTADQIKEFDKSILVDTQLDLEVKELTAFLPIETDFSRIEAIKAPGEESIALLDQLKTRLTDFANNYPNGKKIQRQREMVEEARKLRFIAEQAIREKKEKSMYAAIETERSRLKELKLEDEDLLVRLSSLEKNLLEFKNLYGGQKSGQDHLADYEDVRNQKLVIETVIRNKNERKLFEAIDKQASEINVRGLSEQEKLDRAIATNNRLKEFEKTFGLKTYGTRHAEVVAEIKKKIGMIEASKAEFTAVVDQDDSLSNGTDFDRRLDLLSAYLKNENHPEEYRRKVTVLLSRCKNEHDLAETNKLAKYLSAPVEFEEACVERLKMAESRFETFHDQKKAIEATSNHVKSLLLAADRFVYEKAQAAVDNARKSLKTEALRKARRSIRDYVDVTGIEGTRFVRPVTMKSAIEQHVSWFESINNGCEFPIVLESLDVPKGHYLYDNSILGDCRSYSLTATGAWNYDAKSKSKITTRKDTSYNNSGAHIKLTTLSSELAPGKMKFTLGKSTQTIVVWRQGVDFNLNGFLWYPCSSNLLDSDLYIPAVLAEGIPITDQKGKELTLKIQCEGAEIPKLPQFITGR